MGKVVLGFLAGVVFTALIVPHSAFTSPEWAAAFVALLALGLGVFQVTASWQVQKKMALPNCNLDVESYRKNDIQRDILTISLANYGPGIGHVTKLSWHFPDGEVLSLGTADWKERLLARPGGQGVQATKSFVHSPGGTYLHPGGQAKVLLQLYIPFNHDPFVLEGARLEAEVESLFGEKRHGDWVLSAGPAGIGGG